MRFALFYLTATLLFASCKPQEPESAAPAASQELAEYFPLLPMIEKSLWSQLLEAEGKLAVAPASGREAANKEIASLTKKLRNRHPFKADGEETMERPILWEFSGSDFKDLYSPDLSGDIAIFWHAHDSVLRVDHEGIASGVVKLEPVPHPELKNGDQVVVELVPVLE